MVRNALRVLAFGLGVQHALAQVVVKLESIATPLGFPEQGTPDASPWKPLVNEDPSSLGNAFATVVEGMPHRKLETPATAPIVCFIIFSIVIPFGQAADGTGPEEIAMEVTMTDPVNGACVTDVVAVVGDDGIATARLGLTADLSNPNVPGLCDECSASVVVGACLSGNCDNYDVDAANANLQIDSTLCGDPHMVGLLGQKIDWFGEDNGWYCLVKDSRFQINTRVSAPMPEDFPDRQLVSGVSIITDDGGGQHSLVIELKNPYTTATEGCADHSRPPCLADGALRILVDGNEYNALQTPGQDTVLPGGVVISSANLPVECRPFGGDRIWATQYEASQAATTSRRSLREVPAPFEDWLLDGETIAAPGWCEKFLKEGERAGLSEVQSNHAIFRVETPAVTVRVNIGVNYQDSVSGPDGAVLVPELEFWQIDLAFEGLRLSGTVGGMLGDTSRYSVDHEGLPITSGLGALHGPVASYRVSDPLGVDFEQMHK